MGLISENESTADFQLLESMLWTPAAGYFLFARHMHRLGEAAAFFGFRADRAAMAAEAEAVARGLPASPHKVRLLLDRRGRSHWQVMPLAASAPPTPSRVALLLDPIETDTPFVRFKTSHRPHYDRALAAFPGCDDVLLCNRRGELTESCRANLVVERDGVFLTPPLSSGLLAGTFRAELLAQGEIREHVLYPADLHTAERVFLINSVRKWMPVTLAG